MYPGLTLVGGFSIAFAILVRVALGADRGRVVAQLFAETLVLDLVGACVGLLATGISMRWVFRTFESLEGQLPFWFGPSLP